jgi:hypothetical protein
VVQLPESCGATPALAGALDFDEHAPKHPSSKSREPIADVQRLMPRAEHGARGWARESCGALVALFVAVLLARRRAALLLARRRTALREVRRLVAVVAPPALRTHVPVAPHVVVRPALVDDDRVRLDLRGRFAVDDVVGGGDLHGARRDRGVAAEDERRRAGDAEHERHDGNTGQIHGG